ncbi:hypothetical protein EPN87_04575 [archaeon]|nr:MAG: hypothetical protein EPN87_04575 [archaeon]
MKYFSDEEIRDIAIAVVVITFIFAFRPLQEIFQGAAPIDLASLPLYFFIVVIAFLLHELAHKFVAIKFNSSAVFKIWPQGILLALFLMLFGLKFVAAGAVMISPFKFGRWGFRRRDLTGPETGLIALAGVAVNLVFALLFSMINVVYPNPAFALIYFVNAWLFLFNMLPVPPLDGSRIMAWNIGVWALLIIIGAFLLLPFFL